MRALSVKQPYAELIARGVKTKEYRSWSRDFRGDLLIVASKSPHANGFDDFDGDPSSLVYGAAVCVVDFWKVTGSEGDYAWHLRNPRRVEPVAITGYASIYNVPDEKVRYVDALVPSPPVAARSPRGKAKTPKAKPTGRVKAERAEPAHLLVMVGSPASYECATMAAELDGVSCEVEEYDDGKKLLAAVKAKLPDLVIVKTLMTGRSGLEIANAIKKDVALAHTKTILVGDTAGVDTPWEALPERLKEVLATIVDPAP